MKDYCNFENMKIELKITNDGSSTLYVPQLNEHYHSIHGAITESLHVFIKNGFYKIYKPKIDIIEMGFGTGLNAFLTFLETLKQKIFVYYYSIDLFPLNEYLFKKLNYIEVMNIDKNIKKYFYKFHECEWNKDYVVNDYFVLHKRLIDITAKNPEGKFDIVYYDAFAPSKQPEVWSEEVLKKFYNVMRCKGIFTTYCASGKVKRALHNIGFEVNVLPGPPNKREMINAIKIKQ